LNTFTVTLRVVGGDEKRSLESETVKLGPENDCASEGQWKLQTTHPSSRQRGRPKPTNPQQSDNNQDLVVSPKWVLCTKTDFDFDYRNMTDKFSAI
jgi:hypothetical protein